MASTVAGCHSEHSCRRVNAVGAWGGSASACGLLGGSGGSDAWQEGVRNEATQHTEPLSMRVLYTPRHMSLFFTRKTLWFYTPSLDNCVHNAHNVST